MCARYLFFEPREIQELAERYDAGFGGVETLDSSFNLSPGTVNPVVARRSPNRLVMMRWGLVPFWAKDPKIGWKMFNARAEDIETKPSFRKAVSSQRCLVPANGFYEWQKVETEGKTERLPWVFRLKDRELFSFAGIYDTWRDAEDRETMSYAIITTTPNEVVAKVHDRMPVILEREGEEKWLDQKTPLAEAVGLMKSYPAEKMESWRVSKRVNKAVNDDPALIEPVKA